MAKGNRDLNCSLLIILCAGEFNPRLHFEFSLQILECGELEALKLVHNFAGGSWCN